MLQEKLYEIRLALVSEKIRLLFFALGIAVAASRVGKEIGNAGRNFLDIIGDVDSLEQEGSGMKFARVPQFQYEFESWVRRQKSLDE